MVRQSQCAVDEGGSKWRTWCAKQRDFDGVNEAGDKRDMEPQWSEATMTAPEDVEGCESELSRSVQCR